MNTLMAFLKKEVKAQLRSAKLYIMIGVFILIGAMNPLLTKLIPMLFDVLSEEMDQMGMAGLSIISVSAVESWVQFYENIGVALLAFVLFQSNIFTREYGSGTLVLSLTKGLHRYKVVIAKAAVLIVLWTVCYWLCFGVTYALNEVFWDNGIVKNLFFSGFCWWLYGMLILALVVMFSAMAKAGIVVLAGTGGFVFVCMLLNMLPQKYSRFSPSFISSGSYMVMDMMERSLFTPAILIAIGLIAVCYAVSIPLFNKKKF